jgi:hypothetical protein
LYLTFCIFLKDGQNNRMSDPNGNSAKRHQFSQYAVPPAPGTFFLPNNWVKNAEELSYLSFIQASQALLEVPQPGSVRAVLLCPSNVIQSARGPSVPRRAIAMPPTQWTSAPTFAAQFVHFLFQCPSFSYKCPQGPPTEQPGVRPRPSTATRHRLRPTGPSQCGWRPRRSHPAQQGQSARDER